MYCNQIIKQIMGKFDWNCSECGELQSGHNQYYDGKCETCNFQMKDDVETILLGHWYVTINQEPDNYEDIIQDVYEYILSLDKTVVEGHDVMEGLRLWNIGDKKKSISIILTEKFNQFGMDLPSNFYAILDYVYDDVNSSADMENWHDGDVAIAFRRWVENQTNDTYSQDH